MADNYVIDIISDEEKQSYLNAAHCFFSFLPMEVKMMDKIWFIWRKSCNFVGKLFFVH